jgi:uncharacterized protein YtpQ (UPF0354 family)
MSSPTREQFVEQVLRVVADKFPLVKIARGEESFSVRVNGHAASLENLYRTVLLRPDDSRHQIERWVVELIRAAEGTPDRTSSFDDLKDRILPMILTERADPAHRSTVTQPFVAGLVVAYAIDSDRTIAYLPRSQFEAWEGVTLEQLHETALENLVQRSQAMSAHAAQDEEGQVNLILFQTLDGYDASRVLLPTLHERLREYLGSPFAAAIPNRDILLCFRNDEETVDRLRTQIAEDHRRMPHGITEKLLLVTPDGIAPRD